MASVFYPVPETFRGRFRTDTSRRPYPISYPAGPDARSGFAGTNRHAPNPASRHTTAQTAGTPHTPKAKPPVFRQMLNPSDCSPFIHRHPAFPAASTCLPIPQTPRHRNRPDTAPQAKPARTIGASPPHTRCPDTANVHPAPETTTPLSHATPPSSGQQPTANRTARPPISPPALFRRPHLPHSPYADRQPAEPTFPLPFPDSRRTDTPPVSRRYYRRRMFHFLKK